jgi:hypothetical protein
MDEFILITQDTLEVKAIPIARKIYDALGEQDIPEEISIHALCAVLQTLAVLQGFEAVSVKFICSIDKFLKEKEDDERT